MALQPLSIGDILMLSQTAWKIGRAFTSSRHSAPAEFAEVEREANGLSEALKLSAEALYADGSILSRADTETRNAITSILESAGRTLGDLESFVERYQIIQKNKTTSGFAVQKTWSEAVLANYRTIKWTTEGGTLTDLRNMLQMHTNTISLTMQALQSQSLSRLEKTVLPMAENVAQIHSRVNGDLGDKIDDLHRIIMSVASSTPSLVARDRAIEGRDRRSTVSSLDQENQSHAPRVLEAPPPRSSSNYLHDSVLSTSAHIAPGYFKAYSPQSSGSWTDQGFEAGSPSRANSSIRDVLEDRPGSSGAERSMLQPGTEEPAAESSQDAALKNQWHIHNKSPAAPISNESRRNSYRSWSDNPVLPPPAIPPSQAMSRSRSDSGNKLLSPPQTVNSVKADGSKSPALSSLAAFEKSLFRNAAILCDVRGTLVEYAQKIPDEPDPRYDTEMVAACQECRIVVIRKREHRAHGGTRVATSIWALAADGTSRLQVRLHDYVETVPYSSVFEKVKVSIPPTEGEVQLKFHGERWNEEEEREVKTVWVNYILASENDANLFQSAVFGRMLIGIFATLKSTVIHDGFKGAFALEEQFANIETLRLWSSDGVDMPGAQGGVLCLMHISSSFGDGWARWWMNCSRQQVRVRADGTKFAKLKGIDITCYKPGTVTAAVDDGRSLSNAGEGLQRADTRDGIVKTSGKKVPVKRVTGIRIEFRNEDERDEFVALTHRVQQRLIPLPDL